MNDGIYDKIKSPLLHVYVKPKNYFSIKRVLVSTNNFVEINRCTFEVNLAYNYHQDPEK